MNVSKLAIALAAGWLASYAFTWMCVETAGPVAGAIIGVAGSLLLGWGIGTIAHHWVRRPW